jgi:hypothetical protein
MHVASGISTASCSPSGNMNSLEVWSKALVFEVLEVLVRIFLCMLANKSYS